MISTESGALPYDPLKHDSQYNHLYFCRLMELRPFISAQITERSGIPSAIKDIVVGTQAYSIGVLFVDFPSRPSILSEVSGQKPDPDWKKRYHLYLEDHSARIQVSLSLNQMIPVSSGLVIGLKGSLNSDSVFEPTEYFLPGVPRIQAKCQDRPESIAIINDIPSCPQKINLLKMTLLSPAILNSVS